MQRTRATIMTCKNEMKELVYIKNILSKRKYEIEVLQGNFNLAKEEVKMMDRMRNNLDKLSREYNILIKQYNYVKETKSKGDLQFEKKLKQVDRRNTFLEEDNKTKTDIINEQKKELTKITNDYENLKKEKVKYINISGDSNVIEELKKCKEQLTDITAKYYEDRPIVSIKNKDGTSCMCNIESGALKLRSEINRNYHMKKTVEKLSKELKLKDEEINSYEKDHVEPLECEIKTLKKKIKELTELINEKEKKEQLHRFDDFDKNHTVTKEMAEIMSLKEQIYQLQSSENRAQTRNRELITELNSKNRDTISQEQEENSTKRELEYLKNKNNALNKKLKEKDNHLIYIEAMLKKTENELAKITDHHEQMQGGYNIFKGYKANDEHKIKELTLTLKNKTAEMDLIKKKYRKTIEEIEKQLKQASVKIKQLQSTEKINEKLKEKMTVMKKCLNKDKHQIEKLENELNRLNNKMPDFINVNYPEYMAAIFEKLNLKHVKRIFRKDQKVKEKLGPVQEPIG